MTVQIVFPLPIDKEFTYTLPSHLSGRVSIGSGVFVPFHGRKRMGFVVGMNGSSRDGLEEVISLIDPLPLFNERLLRLSRWMSDYYLCSRGEALKAFLPPGMELKEREVVRWRGEEGECWQEYESEGRDLPSRILLEVNRSKFLTLFQLERRLSENRVPKGEVRKVLLDLEKRGVLEVRKEVLGPRVRPKKEERVRWVGSREEVFHEIALLEKRAPRQASLFNRLLLEPSGLPKRDFVRPNTRKILKRFLEKGWVEFYSEEGFRDPLLKIGNRQSAIGNQQPPPQLTTEQEKAYKTVTELLDRREYGTVLLHGVTGSGKTEVYLRCVDESLRLGRKAIILVPEISLTPQTVSRFLSRFERVTLLHSFLSEGERFDIWRKIRGGEVDIVIGARSAIFAPLEDVGVICVDEEHETSYKQTEHPPLYHGRDVAIMRAYLEKGVSILGSATPSFDSYYKSRRGKFHLLSLPNRIDNRPLPPVEIVDMRREKSNRRSLPILSQVLQEKIRDRLVRGEQTILFLNRRGYAPFLLCQDCGYVPSCSHCSTSLTYHRGGRGVAIGNRQSAIGNPVLLCHYCGHKERAFSSCPRCEGSRILMQGFGTERVEEELKEIFPSMRVLRMDMDTTRRKGSHWSLFQTFQSGEGDLLLGTQMVAKGFDLPKVTLVGVLSAETSLRFPDLRSSERTFQLLTQVAGRTGRSSLGGEVIIQTYSPEHPAILSSAHHDFHHFYLQEMKERARFGYPPFSRIAKILITSREEKESEAEAIRIARLLRRERKSLEMEIFGPAPSLIYRIRETFRWQILLQSPKGGLVQKFLESLGITNRNPKISKNSRIHVDVDPVDLV